jgi:hypothetical protein
LPRGVIDPRPEAPLLFFLADLQPELDQDDPGVDDIFFDLRAQLKEAPMFVGRTEAMTYSTPARLYQLRSKMMISPPDGKCWM